MRGVAVNFGGVAALEAVDIDAPAHTITAVIGPNGAGKTTLLNAISGLIPGRVSGEILLGGASIKGLRPARVAAAGVGRSFQDPQLIENATVLENIMCGGHVVAGYRSMDQLWRWRRVQRSESRLRAHARDAMEFVGLGDCASDSASSLPYGRRKLVDIARAVVTGPRLLLLDEPSSGLDSAEREAIVRLLVELRSAACTTVFVVEHHMDVVRAVASHVVGLQAGAVLATGSPNDVLESGVFRAAVIGAGGPGFATATNGRVPVNGQAQA